MEWFIEFLKTAGGAAIIAGAFEIFRWRRDRKAKKEDAAAQQQTVNCTARGEEIQKLHDEVEILKVAIRVQFYDNIKRKAKEYIDRGYITVEEYEDLKAEHEVYHAKDKLNGNGFLDGLMKDIDHLQKR